MYVTHVKLTYIRSFYDVILQNCQQFSFSLQERE